MTNYEILGSPDDYIRKLEALLSHLQYEQRQVELHKHGIGITWRTVLNLINEFGVPEEAKFAVAAFVGYPMDPEKTRDYVAKLKEVDEAVKNSAGQMTAWLTGEEEVTSHPFNPSVKPMTQTEYHLHVGILTQDARLVVESHGRLSIPVEKSVRIPIVGYHHDGYLSLENEIVPHPAMGHVYEPRLEDRPGMDIRQWNNELPFPAVFGSERVTKLFEKKGLKDTPEVNKALDTITSTLF